VTAIDALRGSRYYSDADIDAEPTASPERPTMNGTTDHLNADQFGTVKKTTRES
jgi:hypothetical protein